MKMVTKEDLVSLKTLERETQQQIQETYQSYQNARDEANLAYQRKIKSPSRRNIVAMRDAQANRRALEEKLRLLRKQLDEKRIEFDRALVEFFGNKPIKKSERTDGSNMIDIYYDGSSTDATGDGLCHAHAIIDETGNIIYRRDRLESHEYPSLDEFEDKTTRRIRRPKPKVSVLYPEIPG
ncbi:hypothetical protein IJH46_01075 [Candidatus Saccharibacteria bacterium]|nr:hypothetical protein [Candidatus Saccharibacteria bacterium]